MSDIESAMCGERFAPRLPAPVSYGFEAGVLRLAWTREQSFTVFGREGRIFTALIAEVHVDREMLPSPMVVTALTGLVVRAPDGTLSRIAGVEAHCTISQGRGAVLGLLLVPLEEP